MINVFSDPFQPLYFCQLTAHNILSCNNLQAKMGNGGTLTLESGLSEAGSSGEIKIRSTSSNHNSGDVSVMTGSGKQGMSGAITLETGFSDSDHSAGSIKLQVGDTNGYRHGGEQFASF